MLAVLGIAQLMLVLDATVVNIALPRAQVALGFSDVDRQWIVTAYSLAFGSLLLIGGRLADAFDRRRMFLAGLVGFTAASALGGAADNLAMLVAARALQGGFAAMLAPAALALLSVSFTEPAARARAFGCFAAISAAGASVGLIFGGTLTEYLGWRSVMYVNVVIAVGALLGAVALPTGRRGGRPFVSDVPGALLAVTGVFAIVYGLSHAATGSGVSAMHDPLTLSLLAAGLVLLAGFVLVERRASHPLLPLGIVRDRDRGGALAAMFLSATGVFGILLFLTYYLETTLGYTPIRTGLAFLPMAATIVLVGTFGNAAIGTRISPRTTLPVGLLIAGIGMAMLTRIDVQPHYVSTVLPATVVTAVGLGLVFAPCFDLGTAGIDESDAGIASAVVHVAQQIGGAIGTALLNTIATTVAARFMAAHAGPTPGEQAGAAVHSYAVVFGVAAATFGVAALVVAALLNPARLSPARLEAAHANPARPSAAHLIPARSNQARSNPAHLSPTHPNPAHPSRAHLDPAHANPARPTAAQGSSTHPNPARPSAAQRSPTHPNPAHPSRARLDPAHTNPARPSAAQGSPTHPNPARPSRARLEAGRTSRPGLATADAVGGSRG